LGAGRVTVGMDGPVEEVPFPGSVWNMVTIQTLKRDMLIRLRTRSYGAGWRAFLAEVIRWRRRPRAAGTAFRRSADANNAAAAEAGVSAGDVSESD